jgi:Pyruvate/2-oxoacid:ferredoxin oxidoreductase delta subunit/flavodoxin
MRIDIFYFSGTGNTAWVVRRLAERLTALGDEVTAMSCEKVSPSDVDPAACDVLGFAFPVFASFAPPVVRSFLRSLPPGEGKSLFAVVTAGYAAGDTAWYATKPLLGRGYNPFLLCNVIVANNFYIPPMDVLPVTPPERLPARLERAGIKVAQIAQRIHQCGTHKEGIGVPGRLLGVLQRLAGEGFESRIFRPFYVDGDCTRCGWCVRHCPAGNIEMTEDGIRFLDCCHLCVRCYSFCSARAIQATKKTRNVRKYRRYGGPENQRYPFED